MTLLKYCFSVYVEISNKNTQKYSWIQKIDKKNVQFSKVPPFLCKKGAKICNESMMVFIAKKKFNIYRYKILNYFCGKDLGVFYIAILSNDCQ